MAILAEHDKSRVWILLESLLDLCDPGDNPRILPDWCDTLSKCLTADEGRYVVKRLQERRDELLREANILDREDRDA